MNKTGNKPAHKRVKKTGTDQTKALAVPLTEDESPHESPRPLSLKEKTVLEFLEFYMGSHGVAPTYQEICNHFGFASFNSVQRYLKQLEFKGYIQLPWANQKRAITLLHASSLMQERMGMGISNAASHTSSPMMSQLMSQRGSGGSLSNVMPMLQPPSQTMNHSLPLLGRVAAGAPIEAYEHDEFIDVPASLVRHAERTYALRVQGQSMIDDGILDGDVILVQRQSTASNGEIVVAMVGEEATVKRFYRKQTGTSADRQIELRPANTTMTSMWFDASEVQIRGIVVGLIRKFM